jgi:hypothetical protein
LRSMAGNRIMSAYRLISTSSTQATITALIKETMTPTAIQ